MTLDELSKKPYAKWLEEVLPELIDMEPMSICMVVEMQDGSTATAYYNCDCTDLAVMIAAVEDDRRMTWIENHAEIIKDILENPDDEGDDEDGLQGVNT